MQLHEQAGAMEEQRDQHEHGEQRPVRRFVSGQTQALVGSGAGVESSGDQAGQQRVHKSL